MTARLDPVSLRLFAIVVEEGTIAAAADREHIAAAAVSRRLSDLEQILGTKLLTRTNRGVSATPAGLSLLYMARSILNELDDIVAQMSEVSAGRRGSVRLLANISAIGQFLPALLHSFAQDHPLIKVLLTQQASVAVTKGVAESLGEIGIFTRLPHGANLEVMPFRTDRLVLCVPEHHGLADYQSVRFEETLDYAHVSLSRGTHLAFQLVKAANDLGRSVKVALEVEGYDAMYLMVRAGLGIAIMPRACANNYRTDKVRILRLDDDWARRELMLCVRSVTALSPAARLLLDHLRAGT